MRLSWVFPVVTPGPERSAPNIGAVVSTLQPSTPLAKSTLSPGPAAGVIARCCQARQSLGQAADGAVSVQDFGDRSAIVNCQFRRLAWYKLLWFQSHFLVYSLKSTLRQAMAMGRAGRELLGVWAAVKRNGPPLAFSNRTIRMCVVASSIATTRHNIGRA